MTRQIDLLSYPEALETIAKARTYADGPGAIATEGHILASMGRHSEARKRLEELAGMLRNENSYVPPVCLAILYTALGDRDAAFIWLEKAYEERSESMVQSEAYGLGVDPYWDPLQEDLRFRELLRRVGLLHRLQPSNVPVESVRGG
jgi:tetratricopeptide (TPR) repeat protein